MPYDLKVLAKDTSVPTDALLFGADNQAAASPSVYPISAVASWSTLVAGGSGWLSSRSGALFTAVSASVPISKLAGRLLRFRLRATKSGTAAGWGVDLKLGSLIVAQWYPGSTQVTLEADIVVWVNSDLSGVDSTTAPQVIVGSQNPASVATVANYGTSMLYATVSSSLLGAPTADTTLTCGLQVSSTDDGRIDYLVVETVPTVMTSPTGAVACWGDSMTLGTGAGTTGIRGTGWAQKLRYTGQRDVHISGIGGERSDQISARMIADLGHRDWTTIIWAGRNDLYQASEPYVADNVAAMIATLTHSRYIVISVLPSTTEATGSGTRNKIEAINATLSAAHTTKYLDLTSTLTNSSGLLGAKSADGVHLNDSGHTDVYNAVAAKLTALGY